MRKIGDCDGNADELMTKDEYTYLYPRKMKPHLLVDTREQGGRHTVETLSPQHSKCFSPILPLAAANIFFKALSHKALPNQPLSYFTR